MFFVFCDSLLLKFLCKFKNYHFRKITIFIILLKPFKLHIEMQIDNTFFVCIFFLIKQITESHMYICIVDKNVKSSFYHLEFTYENNFHIYKYSAGSVYVNSNSLSSKNTKKKQKEIKSIKLLYCN